jgi:putative phosphoesterase
MVERGRFDLILFGHTHRPLTMRMGKALVINPGETCGLMSGRPTCAVVDLDAMSSSIIDISAFGSGRGGGPAVGVSPRG